MAGYDPIHADTLYFHQLLPPDQLHPKIIPTATDHQDHHLSDSGDSKKNEQTAGSSVPMRRSRGRPQGSKNKLKSPIVVSQDSPNSMRSQILEVSSGEDVVQSLSIYAQRRGRGICVLSGDGAVSDVTLKPPEGSGGGSLVTLQGRFDILSLSGTVLPPPVPPGSSGISLFLSGRDGQVVGGSVVGRLVASGPVVLIAASFSNAVFERLPLDVRGEGEVDAMQGHKKWMSQSSVVSSGGGSSGADGGVGDGVFPRGHNSIGSFPFSSDFLG